MSLLWKKRKGNWEVIKRFSKKIQELDEETGEQYSSYKLGTLWYKNNGKWYAINDGKEDIIIENNTAYALESVEDGDMIHLYCPKSLYISRGSSLTTSKRCKGLVLHVEGDLVVAGSISMTARGAKAEGRYVGIDYVNSTVTVSEDAETNPFLADTFKVYVDNTLCDNCTSCVSACTYNAISMNVIETEGTDGTIETTYSGITIDYDKCVNCGACVDACSTVNAITKTYDNLPNHYVIHPTGGIGLAGARSSPGVNGACGSGGGTGSATGGARGGHGTSFSGGAGAGGGTFGYNTDPHRSYGYSGADNGGAGGNGYKGGHGAASGIGGGGAGNPGGAGSSTGTGNSYGANGTGGLLIIIVKGSVVITDTGSINSNGSRGGMGKSGGAIFYGRPGSGSGGGAIHLFYGLTLSGEGKSNITATGGLKGSGSYGGSASNGGDGTVNIAKVLSDGSLQYSEK